MNDNVYLQGIVSDLTSKAETFQVENDRLRAQLEESKRKYDELVEMKVTCHHSDEVNALRAQLEAARLNELELMEHFRHTELVNSVGLGSYDASTLAKKVITHQQKRTEEAGK